MKSLVNYIKESKETPFNGPDYFLKPDSKGFNYYAKIGYKYYNKNNHPTKDEIKDAFATTSNVTGDPSFGYVNGVEFTKIKNNKWQSSSQLQHAIGGTITDNELYQKIENTNEDWYLMLRFK